MMFITPVASRSCEQAHDFGPDSTFQLCQALWQAAGMVSLHLVHAYKHDIVVVEQSAT
jgi:hypothetical protein